VLSSCACGADGPALAVPLLEALAGPLGVVAGCSALIANTLTGTAGGGGLIRGVCVYLGGRGPLSGALAGALGVVAGCSVLIASTVTGRAEGGVTKGGGGEEKGSYLLGVCLCWPRFLLKLPRPPTLPSILLGRCLLCRRQRLSSSEAEYIVVWRMRATSFAQGETDFALVTQAERPALPLSPPSDSPSLPPGEGPSSHPVYLGSYLLSACAGPASLKGQNLHPPPSRAACSPCQTRC